MKSAEGQRPKSEGRAERQLVMRLLVHVEGETEQSFVNEVLASYLMDHGYSAVSVRIVGNARQRIRRGGIAILAGCAQGHCESLEVRSALCGYNDGGLLWTAAGWSGRLARSA